MNNPIITEFVEYIRSLVINHYRLQGLYVGDVTTLDDNDLQLPMLLVKTPFRSTLISNSPSISRNNDTFSMIDYEIRMGVYTKFIEDVNGNQTLITKEQEDNLNNYVSSNNLNKLSVEVMQLGDTERYLHQIIARIVKDFDESDIAVQQSCTSNKFEVRSVNVNGFVSYSDNFLVGSEATLQIRTFNKYYCEADSTDVFSK